MVLEQTSGYILAGSSVWNNTRYTVGNTGTAFVGIDEHDTKRFYKANNTHTAYTFSHQEGFDRGFYEHQDSSVSHHFGHKFARTIPTIVALTQLREASFAGSDLKVGSQFTKVGADDYINQIGSLSGTQVTRLDGTDGSYCHIPENDLLGTDSFLMGAWFRPRTISRREPIFFNGTVLGKRLEIFFDAGNNIHVVANDGTNNVEITKPARSVRNGDWHWIGILFNRVYNTMMLVVSNGTQELNLISTVSIPDTFGDFTITDGELVIGGTNATGTKLGGFRGDVSNFQLYEFPNEIDYNILPLLLAGIREGAVKDAIVTNSRDSTKRFNNDFVIEGNEGSHAYALCNLEEGVYQPIVTHHHKPDGTIYGFQLDHTEYGRFDLHTDGAGFSNTNAFLDNIKSPKSTNFLKVRLYGTGKASFSQIKLHKIGGDSTGGSSQGIIAGDELIRRSNDLVQEAVINNNFVSALKHIDGDTPEDGSFAEGDVFFDGGLHDFTLYTGQSPNGGNMELLLNGEVIMTANGFGTNRTLQSKQVFVPHGKNVIRIQVNGKLADSSGFSLWFNGLRYNLRSNNTFSDNTTIHSTDPDIDIITGNDSQKTFRQSTSATLGSELILDGAISVGANRVFAGGLYVVTYNILKTTAGGFQSIEVKNDKIGLNTTIFPSIPFDLPSGAPVATTIQTMIMIPKGHHDVIINNFNGNNIMAIVDFQCIGRFPIGGDSKIDASDSDGLVLIGYHNSRRNKDNVTMNFAGITPAKFDEIIIKTNGRTTGSNTIGLNINGITNTDYRKTGDIKVNGQQHGDVNSNNPDLVLVTDGLLVSDSERFKTTTSLEFGERFNNSIIISGEGRTTTHPYGHEVYSWSLVGNNVESIDSLTFHGTADWYGITRFRVYGRRRVN